ncbi:Phosphatidylinositol phosphatase PTPRQ [Geodia barretti]|uniref:Phosphatidylinositol phosphatase PTPRQ n=1 Tax=Geodia barretti TaxID=519541 RepID=A0AA35XIP7_GEOBA|nr:Phosphatidylinositol phosphatase PTPRQ [Geodia barretti]
MIIIIAQDFEKLLRTREAVQFAKMGIKAVALLFSSAFIAIAYAQTGVCTRAEAVTTIGSYYIQTSYYYTYSCGIFGWSRCGSTSYGSALQYRSDTSYNLVYECCAGYHDPAGGISCEPFCEDCDSNHTCIAPYTCICPEGWTGDNCDEDIDECFEGTSNCEQLCTNTNGSYFCTCYDDFSLGLDSHSCLGPPQNVSLNASSSMTLHLDWEGPQLDERDGSVTSYEVNCTSSFGYYHLVSVDVGLLEYDLVNLAPFSNYTCCASALTTNGHSSTVCATEETLQDIPSDVPQNVTVNNHSAYAVIIEWEPPLTPNGIITLYTIYADYNNGTSQEIDVKATDRIYKLNGLSPHQLISINISASTVIGEGPLSSTISERTSQAVPSQVTDFEVSALSPNELLVSWSLPEYHNGILTKYKIVVYNKVYNYTVSLFVPDTSTNVTVSDGIEPFVPYTVVVSAFTHAGEGIALSQIIFSEEGVPSVEPELILSERTDATSLHLLWEALSLEELRGFLDSYVVVFEELNTYQCLDLDPLTSNLF